MRWRSTQGRLPPNVEVDEFFFQAGTRLGVAASQRSYISRQLHPCAGLRDRARRQRGRATGRQARARRRDPLQPELQSPTSRSICWRARRAGGCDFLFVGQVNSELPFMPGDADIAAGEFDFMLDGPQTDFPLFAPPREPIDLAEYAAGLHVARTVADGGTLQLGIGSLGDAVAQALILRHRRNAEFRDILARLDPADRRRRHCARARRSTSGLHGVSEMLVEGFLDLMRAGILKREVDGTLLQAAFFLGSRAFYRALREMPEAELAKLRMTVGLVRQRALRRRGARQAARPGQGALHQQRHDGDPARRRGVRCARGRPGRERRRRPIQFRRPELRAGRRPLHHHAARDPRRRRDAPPRTSAGATATPRSRAICATSW